MARALGLLARREHSRLELSKKLGARGFPRDVVARVIDRLEQSGALSESRFEESYIRARAARGFGPMRITAELRERGIDVERAALANFDWSELCEEARHKRFGGCPPARGAQWQKQARFLHGRGFPESLIRRVLSGRAASE